MSKKIIRITTVPMALKYLLPGQMRYMRENGFEVLMISSDGPEIADIIKNEGCRHMIVPMTRRITPWQDMKCLFRLIQIFRKEKPAIVHSHTPKAGLLAMLAARICFVKIRIHTIAGLPLMVEQGFKFRLLKLIERITAAAANHIWPNSESLKAYILEHQLASEHKVKVISKGSTNGIDTERFSRQDAASAAMERVKKSIGYSAGHTYFLSVGRMVADKGIPELVEVFCTMQESYPQLVLVLIGKLEPDLDPLPHQTLATIRQNPAIIHVAWSDEIEFYMSAADYFIFPSHREGFPNVLLQAGAIGLPIICSNIAGNIDIVTNNETGLIFERENRVQMQAAIEKALLHPDKAKEMALLLKNIIDTHYRREIIWAALKAEYDLLLHNN